MTIAICGDNNVLVVDQNLVRLVKEDRVELYPTEAAAHIGKNPTSVFIASEAKRYLRILSSKLDIMTGDEKSINKLKGILNA